MVTKLKEHEGWEHDIFENIDWQSRAMTIKGMKANDKKHIFKMIHGSIPVMRQQKGLDTAILLRARYAIARREP
jgi:hypothetical protein